MENLRSLRKQKGMSMKELGDLVGVSESTISLYETGKRKPDPDMLVKLASVFYVTVDYLLGREPKETDDEMLQLLQDIKDDPDKRMLFSLSQKASPEDVKVMVKFLEGITKSDNDE